MTSIAVNDWIFFLELLALACGALLATFHFFEWLGDRAINHFVQQRDEARVVQIEDHRRRQLDAMVLAGKRGH